MAFATFPFEGKYQNLFDIFVSHYFRDINIAVAPGGRVKAVRFHYELAGRLILDKMDPQGEDSH